MPHVESSPLFLQKLDMRSADWLALAPTQKKPPHHLLRAGIWTELIGWTLYHSKSPPLLLRPELCTGADWLGLVTNPVPPSFSKQRSRVLHVGRTYPSENAGVSLMVLKLVGAFPLSLCFRLSFCTGSPSLCEHLRRLVGTVQSASSLRHQPHRRGCCGLRLHRYAWGQVQRG